VSTIMKIGEGGEWAGWGSVYLTCVLRLDMSLNGPKIALRGHRNGILCFSYVRIKGSPTRSHKAS
jgi:hypothetical protein